MVPCKIRYGMYRVVELLNLFFKFFILCLVDHECMTRAPHPGALGDQILRFDIVFTLYHMVQWPFFFKYVASLQSNLKTMLYRQI